MDYNDIKELKGNGFQGFVKIKDLQNNKCNYVINSPGVYLVLFPNDQNPIFLEENIGGHFKGRNPTVPKNILEDKWVDSTKVIYIGQAGGGKSKATLQKRLWQYMRFGKGEPVGHWGGRYIWQLSNSDELIICWKIIINEDSKRVESELIENFKYKFGKRPFANLNG